MSNDRRGGDEKGSRSQDSNKGTTDCTDNTDQGQGEKKERGGLCYFQPGLSFFFLSVSSVLSVVFPVFGPVNGYKSL